VTDVKVGDTYDHAALPEPGKVVRVWQKGYGGGPTYQVIATWDLEYCGVRIPGWNQYVLHEVVHG